MAVFVLMPVHALPRQLFLPLLLIPQEAEYMLTFALSLTASATCFWNSPSSLLYNKTVNCSGVVLEGASYEGAPRCSNYTADRQGVCLKNISGRLVVRPLLNTTVLQ
jgi:hypothetical protein